jgi:hypothetical protein
MQGVAYDLNRVVPIAFAPMSTRALTAPATLSSDLSDNGASTMNLTSDANGVLRDNKAAPDVEEDIVLNYGSAQTLQMASQPLAGFYVQDSVYTIEVPDVITDDNQPKVTVVGTNGTLLPNLPNAIVPINRAAAVTATSTFEDGLIRFVIYSGLQFDFVLNKVDGEHPTAPNEKMNAEFMLSEFTDKNFDTLTTFKDASQIANDFAPIEQVSTVNGRLELNHMVQETPNLNRGVVYKLEEIEAPNGFLTSKYDILIYKDIDQKIYIRLAENDGKTLKLVDFDSIYKNSVVVDENNEKVTINFPNFRPGQEPEEPQSDGNNSNSNTGQPELLDQTEPTPVAQPKVSLFKGNLPNMTAIINDYGAVIAAIASLILVGAAGYYIIRRKKSD